MMGGGSSPIALQGKVVSYNNNQNIGSYPLYKANGGDVMFQITHVFNRVAGGGLVSMSIETDDGTPLVLMTAVEGAVAGLLANVDMAVANKGKWYTLKSGKSIFHKINGTNGNAGSGEVGVLFSGPLS